MFINRIFTLMYSLSQNRYAASSVCLSELKTDLSDFSILSIAAVSK